MNKHIQFFKAISDEVRHKIIESLRAGEKNVGNLSEELNLSQPRVSHHLKILNTADIVRMSRRGKNIFCRLNTDYISSIYKDFFDKYGNGNGNGNGNGDGK